MEEEVSSEIENRSKLRDGWAAKAAWAICLAALSTALLIAVLLGIPGAPVGCGGSASQYVSLLGAGYLGLVLLCLVLLRRTSEGRTTLAILLLATVTGHGALMATRQSDLCTPCKIIFGLECLAMVEGLLWMCYSVTGRQSIRRQMGDLLRGGLAASAVGAIGLGAVIDAGNAVEILSDEEIRTHLAGRPGKPESFVLNVILRSSCSRCQHYEQHEHPFVVAALPKEAGIKMHEEYMPGQPRPRAFPCIIITTVGSNEVLARIDGVLRADAVVDIIEKLEQIKGVRVQKTSPKRKAP